MKESDKIIFDNLVYVHNLGYMYKYTSAENGILMLENSQLHFNSPLKFNDPFDCHPSLIKIDDQFILNTIVQGGNSNILNQRFTNSPQYLYLVKKFTRTKEETIKTKILPTVKISCFSERKNNLLMWSHYAKYHTGVCFEFDTKKMIDHIVEFSKLNGQKGLFLKVNYDQERENQLFESSDNELPLIMWVKTKSSDWDYEKEIRLIFLKWEDNLISIPSSVITKVYLGSQISDNDEQKIIQICKANFLDSKIYKMSLSDEEFKLTEELLA